MKRTLLPAIILSCTLTGGSLWAQDMGRHESTRGDGRQADASEAVHLSEPAATTSADGEGRKRWTLSQCIEHAKQNNIQILQQELSQDDAEIALLQSKLDYVPSISASAGTGVSFGRVLDPTTYNFIENSTNTDVTLGLSAGMDVFGGMKKLHTLRRSQLNLKANLLSIEKAKNDLALNVTAAYLDILFSEEKVKIADSQIATLRMQAEQSEKLVTAGKKTISDLLQMQGQLAEARHQSILTYNQRKLAYFTLCQLLEIADFTNFAVMEPGELIVDTNFSLSDPSSADEIMDAAQNLPQIGRAKLDIEIADRNISIARSHYYPTLRLAGNYGSSYSETRKDMMNFGTQLKNFAGGSVSLSLSIPIFNSLSARNSVKSQKIAYQRAEYDMLVIQKQLGKEIQQALIDAGGALEQYHSAYKAVITNEESFRMIKERYEIGAASPVDYSVALYNLVNARSQLAQAKYQYLFKAKILDFYKGIPIEL